MAGKTEFLSLGMTISLGEGKTLNSNLLNSALKLTLCQILFVGKGLANIYMDKPVLADQQITLIY